jgi:hypothetical protein
LATLAAHFGQPNQLLFPLSGPAPDSFNGLHHKPNFLALTTPKVEAPDTPMGAWQELAAPVSTFADQVLVSVVMDRPRRFFS